MAFPLVGQLVGRVGVWLEINRVDLQGSENRVRSENCRYSASLSFGWCTSDGGVTELLDPPSLDGVVPLLRRSLKGLYSSGHFGASQLSSSATAPSESNLRVRLRQSLSGSRWDGDAEMVWRTPLMHFMESGTKTWNRYSKENGPK